MLVRIGSPARIPAFLEGVKAKKEKLFGFGHRVYKNFDPRAKLIQQVADEARTPTSALLACVVDLSSAQGPDPWPTTRGVLSVAWHAGHLARAPPSLEVRRMRPPSCAEHAACRPFRCLRCRGATRW